MITKFHAENYGCLRDLTLTPTPIHALIGPNDSGKSTILSGIRTLASYASASGTANRDPRLLQSGLPSDTVLIGAGETGEYSLRVRNGSLTESVRHATEQGGAPVHRDPDAPSRFLQLPPGRPDLHAVLAQMDVARLVRFDAEALRAPSGLIPESRTTAFVDDRGRGLPGIYQSVQGRGDEAFHEISERVRGLFPTVRLVRVAALTSSELEVRVELTDGTIVRAAQMSEGLLYFLAFAALPYLAKTSILLVEEPENGLHPARIADVMQVLRELSATTQVIIATHSPLVINCLKPDEVSVVTRTSLEEGTQATLIRDTPNFEKRSSIYELGELWLSYADGKVEAPLMQGDDRAIAAGG